MGTTVKLKESSNVFDPDTGQFFPVTALDLFRQGGITPRDYPDYFSDSPTTLYGDALAGYEGVRNAAASIGVAQAQGLCIAQ